MNPSNLTVSSRKYQTDGGYITKPDRGSFGPISGFTGGKRITNTNTVNVCNGRTSRREGESSLSKIRMLDCT